MVTVDNADNEELEMINNSHKNDWIFKVNYESGAWSYFFIQKTKDGKMALLGDTEAIYLQEALVMMVIFI